MLYFWPLNIMTAAVTSRANLQLALVSLNFASSEDRLRQFDWLISEALISTCNVTFMQQFSLVKVFFWHLLSFSLGELLPVMIP